MKTIIDMINLINQNIFNYDFKNILESYSVSKLEEKSESSNEVTKLQMHKILFFIYGSFYKKFGIKLWDANFEAWKYGPVEVNYYKNSKLNNPYDLNKLNIEQIKYLDKKIQSLLKTSIWNLVEFSHSLNCWLNHYNLKNNKITHEEIVADFIEILF